MARSGAAAAAAECRGNPGLVRGRELRCFRARRCGLRARQCGARSRPGAGWYLVVLRLPEAWKTVCGRTPGRRRGTQALAGGGATGRLVPAAARVGWDHRAWGRVHGVGWWRIAENAARKPQPSRSEITGSVLARPAESRNYYLAPYARSTPRCRRLCTGVGRVDQSPCREGHHREFFVHRLVELRQLAIAGPARIGRRSLRRCDQEWRCVECRRPGSRPRSVGWT